MAFSEIVMFRKWFMNKMYIFISLYYREPSFFKKTMFLVDRMHMRGHTGCCKGYDMDSYQTLNIKRINSQVNEQENAGLARIKGQLAYMLPSNFMFHAALFLALRNKCKIKSIRWDIFSTRASRRKQHKRWWYSAYTYTELHLVCPFDDFTHLAWIFV